MANYKIPNMLAYARSINPTDALFYAVKEGQDVKTPVLVEERGSRSPFSNYSETKNVEKNPARGNPKSGDVAFLPVGTDSLVISFSVAFTGNSLAPYSCGKDSAELRGAMTRLTEAFEAKGGYRVLAKKYLDQILNGSCGWRNLESAEEVVVSAMTRKHGVVATTDIDGTTVDDQSAYEAMVDQIAKALATPKGIARVNVEIMLPMSELAEVYPSQSFKENAKGRLLSSKLIDTKDGQKRQAIIHNQKIGNAIRRIDDWYGDGEAVHALAVEPFGIDRSLDRAVRIEAKRDFYTLLQKKTDEFIEVVESASDVESIPGDVFYYVACLIRGGVFSGKEG